MEDTHIEEPEVTEQQVDQANPITLELDDTTLAQFVNRRIEASQKFYKEKGLYERQKKNEAYRFGRVVDESKLKDFEARYMDNVIFEAESTIKPIALSRLPDLYVTEGNDPTQFQDSSKKITELINSEIRRRRNRRVLSLAFQHVPVGFIGATKYRWNPNKGRYGDYEFYVVHYSRLTLDHHAKTNDPNDMEYIAELVEKSVQELVMLFPAKKEELFNKLGIRDDDKDFENKMASTLDIHEVWFKYPVPRPEGEGFDMVSGVLWKYQDIIFDKMKNPNWDWEGEVQYSMADPLTGAKRPATNEDMMQMAMSPLPVPGFTQEKVYRNYFQQPEFPYIFMGYDQFGTMPYDETSRIEQNIYKQDNVNKRGKQITEIADRAKGKNIFSSGSGLKKEDIEELDMDDPDVDVWVDGDVEKVHKFIPGEQPQPALFEDQDLQRQRIFQSMGANDTTRGVKQTDTLGVAEELKDSDYGRIDDVVEDTINYASEKMAQACLHMIKLRYTPEHYVTIFKKDGTAISEVIQGEMIQEGMQVVVHSSGVDKLMRKREAYEKAKLNKIDPLSFFEDTDTPNPKERTERLMLFNLDPMQYYTKYILGMPNGVAMAGALGGMPPPGGPPPGPPGPAPAPQPGAPETGAAAPPITPTNPLTNTQ